MIYSSGDILLEYIYIYIYSIKYQLIDKKINKKMINIYLIFIFVSFVFIILLVFFKSCLKVYFIFSLNSNFKLFVSYIHYIMLHFHHYYTIFCIFLYVIAFKDTFITNFIYDTPYYKGKKQSF